VQKRKMLRKETTRPQLEYDFLYITIFEWSMSHGYSLIYAKYKSYTFVGD